MSDNGNGAELPALPDAPQMDAMTRLQNDINKLNGPTKLVIGTMIRGLQVSAPGIEPAAILHVIAWHTGNLLASAVQGDPLVNAQARNGFRDAFEDGMKKAPTPSSIMRPGARA